MEALFSTTLASYEAWLMVLCVIVFFGIYLFDGIAFMQRVYAALRPAQIKKDTALIAGETGVSEVTSPLLEPIAPEEVEAHEAEKAKAEEKHEQEIMKSEVFEEKVLEEIKEQGKIDEAEKTETEEVKLTEEAEKKEKVQEIASEIEVEEKVSHTPDEPVVESTEAIEEDAETITSTEESEEVIENDLEEKEKIEEELLDVEKVETIDSLEDQETKENKEEETIEEKNKEEAIIEEDAIEIESELQEEAEEVEQAESIQKQEETEKVEQVEDTSIISSEVIAESRDPTEQIEDRETSEEVSTQDTALATEDVQLLPITASIPEPAPEVRKSTESQYTERLYAMTNEVKTLIARGHPQDARALIIQGLALDKNHRELNLILGSIYESERQAQKAEYIYKDLALIYPEDGEILERLANILIIEKRYDLALEIYKKIISLSSETEGSLYIMTHLSHELGHHEELYAYARRYQKNWPNNPDILTLLAQAEIALGERQAAIQTLIKLKNLTPYNNEIMETIAKLTMEEELAGNFGGEKI